MRPTVSFLTPVYNHAPFIGQCIESVLTQTYSDWEQIIVDDGSTDETPEIVRQYRDPRISYYRLEHRGIGALEQIYGFALDRAQGEFLAILEGDDSVPPWKLKSQLASFGGDTVLSYGPVLAVDSWGRTLGKVAHFPWKWKVRNNTPPGSILRALLLGNFIPAVSMVVRRAALDRIGGFHQPSYANWIDYPLCLKLASIGTFSCIREITGYYRRHRGQDTYLNARANQLSGARYAVEFCRQVAKEGTLDSRLIPDPIRLERSLRVRAEARALLDEGRKELLDACFAGAIQVFLRLLRTRWTPGRIAAVFGVVHALLRIDMEWVFRLLRMNPISR